MFGILHKSYINMQVPSVQKQGELPHYIAEDQWISKNMDLSEYRITRVNICGTEMYACHGEVKLFPTIRLALEYLNFNVHVELSGKVLITPFEVLVNGEEEQDKEYNWMRVLCGDRSFYGIQND